MPYIPIVPPDDASPEVKAVYEEFHRRMSFPSPSNFIMTQGHSSTVARGTWEAVKNILVTGAIPRWQKEMMFVAISKDRACQYCTAAHIACCRMLGVKPEVLEGLVRNVSNIPDPKLRDMIKFALQCSRNPQGLKETDYESLRQHGLNTSQIMDSLPCQHSHSRCMRTSLRMPQPWNRTRCSLSCDFERP